MQGIIDVNVNDFFWAGLNIFKGNVISKLQSRFKVEKETASAFKCVDTTVFFNKMFSEIYFGGQKDLPIEVITDNQSCMMLYSPVKAFQKDDLGLTLVC